MKTIISLAIFTLLSLSAQAKPQKNLEKDLDTLGDNPAVVDRVKNLDSQQKVRVVQNRLIDRNNRVELGLSYGALSGGDSYVNTTNVGGMLQYHLNPRFSFGVEYLRAYNGMTNEGQRVYDQAYQEQQKDPNSPQKFPAVDFPLETTLATVSFYPIYGKLNLFDSSIAQFDIYTLLGYGKKKLDSGTSDTFAAGLGSGVWLNSWLTARLEVRYERYKDLLQSDRRDQNTFSGMASMGIMIW